MKLTYHLPKYSTVSLEDFCRDSGAHSLRVPSCKRAHACSAALSLGPGGGYQESNHKYIVEAATEVAWVFKLSKPTSSDTLPPRNHIS